MTVYLVGKDGNYEFPYYQVVEVLRDKDDKLYFTMLVKGELVRIVLDNVERFKVGL